jgi:hypothetical protein
MCALSLASVSSSFLALPPAIVLIHPLYYTFCRVQRTLGITPATQAGVADHVWTPDEVAALLDQSEKL